MRRFNIILIAFFLNSCSANNSGRIYEHQALKNIEFLQFTKTQTQWLEAYVEAKLVLDKSCFRLTNGSTIIFPSSFYMSVIDEQIVIKEEKKVVGIVGKVISTGGGWVSNIDHLPVTPANKCKSKSYFLVGKGFKLK